MDHVIHAAGERESHIIGPNAHALQLLAIAEGARAHRRALGGRTVLFLLQLGKWRTYPEGQALAAPGLVAHKDRARSQHDHANEPRL